MSSSCRLKERHTAHDIYDGRIYRALRRVIAWCVQHRIIVVAATALIFVGSIFAFGKVQQQFFPRSERPELFLQLYSEAAPSVPPSRSSRKPRRCSRMIATSPLGPPMSGAAARASG